MRQYSLFFLLLTSLFLAMACNEAGSAPSQEGVSFDLDSIPELPVFESMQDPPKSFNYMRGKPFTTIRQDPVECNFSVKIKDYMPPNGCKLIGTYAEQTFLVTNAEMQDDGTAVFKSDSGYVGGLYYVAFSDQLFVQVILGKDQVFSMETTEKNSVDNMKVKGSMDNQLLYEAFAFDKKLNPEFNKINKALDTLERGTAAYDAAKAEQSNLVAKRMSYIRNLYDKHPDLLFPKFKLAGQNPTIEPPRDLRGEIDNALYAYMYRSKFWDGFDFGDGRLLRTPVLHNKLKRFMKDLTPQVADSVLVSAKFICDKAYRGGDPEIFKHVINWVAVQYDAKAPVMGAEKVLVHIIQNYFTDSLAYWTTTDELEKIQDKAIEMELSLLGKIGQDVEATDPDGNMKSLYGLQAPVKVVFIYTTDCEHCKEASPEMQKFYQEWKGKGVEVFGICSGRDENDFKNFVKRYGFTFTNVQDRTPGIDSNYYLKYHIDITPEIYVLDKDHKIIAKNLKPFQLTDIVKKELGVE